MLFNLSIWEFANANESKRVYISVTTGLALIINSKEVTSVCSVPTEKKESIITYIQGLRDSFQIGKRSGKLR